MDNVKRTILNTLAQHIKTVLNVCLSLYSTRLILQALGQSDFGLFSLVGGIVVMLGFITNAMAVSTQRHLSFQQGKRDKRQVNAVFVNSMFLHIGLGVTLCLVLSCLTPFLFDGFLNIEKERVFAGKIVYLVMLVNLFITFITTPYRATFIARENMVYLSIVDILDGVLKVGVAVFLLYASFDRLILYSFFVTGISLFNLFALGGYATVKYKECGFLNRFSLIKKDVLKEISGFAGWTIYSMGCIIGRNQGLAVLLNLFLGTLINTAYGITLQISTSVQYVSQAVINALSPQVIKAEGENNRKKMLKIAEMSSKYAYLLLSLVVIPLVFEMDNILYLWLDRLPQYTSEFCVFVLLSALIDQLTIGLGIANQAIGRIRNYSLVINTIKILTLPASWTLLKLGYGLQAILWCYLLIELLCASARLPFLRITADLSIRHYISHVIIRNVGVSLLLALSCYILTTYIDAAYRFLLTFSASIMLGLAFIWLLALEKTEREYLIGNILKRKTNNEPYT